MVIGQPDKAQQERTPGWELDPRPLKVEVTDLSKIFKIRQQALVALEGITFDIPEGEFFCIVGPSGCGKTTLLRILAGLETHTSGGLRILAVDKLRPLNSMIFQEQSIFPWMTVRSNIAYGLRMRRTPRRIRDPIVEHYMRKVGLSRFADCYPFQLSGGMKQRVSVARAFANDPEILLMDEPFASLDEQNKLLLQEELLRIWEETRKTVVFVTHSIDETLVLADRVMIMTAHPGRIKAIVDVDFPRPRRVIEVKTHPRFAELSYHVWSLLRDEVLRAREEEGLT